MTEDNDTEAVNITKPFCQNVNLSESEMFVYRYVLVLVQYIIPVIIISFVYIQVIILNPFPLSAPLAPSSLPSRLHTARILTRNVVFHKANQILMKFVRPFRWPLSSGAAKRLAMHKVSLAMCSRAENLIMRENLSLKIRGT